MGALLLLLLLKDMVEFFDGLNGDDVVRGEGGIARREEVFGLS